MGVPLGRRASAEPGRGPSLPADDIAYPYGSYSWALLIIRTGGDPLVERSLVARRVREGAVMRTIRLADGNAVFAPDGSQIRELVAVTGGSMVHCSLPKGAVSRAVAHATVDEVWYCLAGGGQMWRRQEGGESVVDIEPGVALTIECGTHFQFRNTGDEDLRCVIVTIPPWPGAREARRVRDRWAVTEAAHGH